MTETTKWDIIDSLTSEKTIESYLEAIFEDGDPGLIKAAIGDVERARSINAMHQ